MTRIALIIPLLISLLSACGGGAGQTECEAAALARDVTGSELIEQADVCVRQRLFDHMADRYLWFDSLPQLDLSDDVYANLRDLLNELRNKDPQDRFSAVLDGLAFTSRVEQGLQQSFGFRFHIISETPLDLRVAAVSDFSTVGRAGIQRGDRIISVQGTDIDELGVAGFRDAIFADPDPGVSLTLGIRHPDGTEAEYVITRTEHAIDPVRKEKIFDLEDIDWRVGYVQVTEFIEATVQQFDQMRSFLQAAEVDDVVLDLRYNSGGLVRASRDLASSFLGQSSSGDVYTTLQRNELHRDQDFTYFFRQFNNALRNLDRIFILTTGSTCSASEEIINGLNPFMQVITIGETTCGKPYAARPFPLVSNLVIANILESRSVNANGDGDFVEGFAPTCPLQDLPTLPFDDENESLIAGALQYIRNGTCPIMPNDAAALAKSLSGTLMSKAQNGADIQELDFAIVD